MDEALFLRSAEEYPPAPNVQYVYGTAGFRMTSGALDSVLFRVGVLAALRSKSHNGQFVGVMVTASHNPEDDNGVKLVDPHGEMLEASWEVLATALANAGGPETLLAATRKVIAEVNINLSQPAAVVYGHDTRPSCPRLVAALEAGLHCFPSIKLVASGLNTTPQLHYLVRCLNETGTAYAYGKPTEEGYYEKLSAAFITLNRGRSAAETLTVDCANGVGAPKLKALQAYLKDAPLRLDILGDQVSSKGALNHGCGADFVKTKQKAPPSVPLKPLARYCSFDGDADRIVYYYTAQEGTFKLLDGDKIAGLAATFLSEMAAASGVSVNIGVVQTAYANGSSTKYLEEVLRLPVACTPTGVKHLHHAAEAFDIGIYFEANGHGTILFSAEYILRLRNNVAGSTSQRAATETLLALHDLVNQTVGDAISDMLLVETILLHRQSTPAEWDAAYTDLPNRLVKVTVADRHAFTTTDAERRLVSPSGIQELVDAAVGRVERGRSFVRPSGTEDCVRVYAEAATRQDADTLAFTVAGIVHDRANPGAPKPAEFL